METKNELTTARITGEGVLRGTLQSWPARAGTGSRGEISYDYDLKDRVTYANDYLGPVFQYEYDKNGRLLKET